MSEYWKSTPNYWCKFCQTYVRDTKLERQKHESTARHQGQIQRSLRDLHRGKEREERESQRAKDEIARLNGVVGKKSGASSSTAPVPSTSVAKAPPTFTRQAPKQATAEDRKRQMAQLSAMGIAIPDEYRRDMAMAGEWQTLSSQPVPQQTSSDIKPNPDAIAKGFRKRVQDNPEDEEEEEAKKPRKAWGSQVKSYPGKNPDVDLDSLLTKPIQLKQDSIKEDQLDEESIKKEEPAEDADAKSPVPTADTLNKEDDDSPAPNVIFKKRKKVIRNT